MNKGFESSMQGRAALRLLLVMVMLGALLGAQPARPVQAAQVCTSVSLPAVADTYMHSNTTTYNYGAATTVVVNQNYDRGALLRWDLGLIPTNATVSAASVTLNITEGSNQTFDIYYLRRTWVEGSGNGSATGDGATWNTTNGSSNWGTAGASNTSNDRSNTSMGTVSSQATGNQTFNITHSVVQNWVNGSIANHGLTIQRYNTNFDGDLLIFSSREGGSAPLLNVTYCFDGRIGEQVWVDTNSNGVQDDGVSGLAGVAVSLRRTIDDSQVAATVTNATGQYYFAEPGPGEYYLRFTLPSGYGFTQQNQPTDPADELDSDVDPVPGQAYGDTAAFTWTGSESDNFNFDAGLITRCATITRSITTNSDDAEERTDTGAMNSNTTGTLDLRTGSGGIFDQYRYYHWGFRFTNITIPPNMHIQSATITLQSTAAQSGVPASTTIFGQNVDNAGTFGNGNYNISSTTTRPRTTASVPWNIPALANDQYFSTPNMASIVQEIYNRQGWTSGSAMVFLMITGTSQPRSADSYEGIGAAPQLTITYCNANPTSANVSYFRANKAEGGVQLSWGTVSEANTAGFNLYRSERGIADAGDDFVQLNTELIPPQAPGQADGADYLYLDPTADPGLMYTYKLEDISTDLNTLSETSTTYYPYEIQLPMLIH